MLDKIAKYLEGAATVAIAGHTRPDGDCAGSCLALYNYLLNNYPQLSVDIYLEPLADVYQVIKHADHIKILNTDGVLMDAPKYDVFFALDSSDKERLAAAGDIFERAKLTVCIDHHVSNMGYAMENIIYPQASSACEVLSTLLDMDYVNQDIAEALYIGLICDTGCFKHSNTSEQTMILAGKLISKGVRFSKLTDEVFYQKTYMQNLLLGRCLLESFRMFDGRVIISVAGMDMMSFYQAKSSDLEGVIDQMRITKGVEVAILLTQIEDMKYKVSMRSNEFVDVANVASKFGGGGHVRAAGCTLKGDKHSVINMLTEWIEEQLIEYDQRNN